MPASAQGITVDYAFRRLLLDIQPSERTNVLMNRHVEQIRTRVSSSFDVAKIALIGSHWKKTAVDRWSDADLLVVLRREEIRRWNTSGSSSGILRRVATQLKARYPQTSVRRDAQAVRVQFAASHIAIDVVPAQFHEFGTDPSYLIPDGSGGWLVTSPSAQRRLLNRVQGASGGKLLRTVQLLKWWAASRTTTRSVSSLFIETLLIHVGAPPGLTYGQVITLVLDSLHKHRIPDLADPTELNPAGIRPCSTPIQRAQIERCVADARPRAHKALEAEGKGNHRRAIYYWNLVFNNTFC